jgi:hypothetical protein
MFNKMQMVMIPMRNVVAPTQSHGIRNLRCRFLKAATRSRMEQTIKLIDVMTNMRKIHRNLMFPAIQELNAPINSRKNSFDIRPETYGRI